MLNDKEKVFAREILELLDLKDLITLTDTVTNRAVSAENRKEATDAILLYSVNAAQLLRRRKVKRHHLYRYLASKGHVESVSADKPTLYRKILQLWGSNVEKFDKDEEEDDDDDDGGTSEPQNEHPAVEQTRNLPAPNAASVQGTVTAIDGQALAEKFTQWFYNIFNSLIHGNSAGNEWGQHHFWNDAKCTIAMLSEQHLQEDCQGAEAVSMKLAEVVSKEKLFFNISTPSVKGEINNYGLVRILASGTVHRFDCCIGIFEQTFGLIRDPHTDNNWKIKFTQLRLKAQGQLPGQQAAALPAGSSSAGQLTLANYRT